MAESILVLVGIVYIIAFCSHLNQKFTSIDCKDIESTVLYSTSRYIDIR